MKHLFCGSNIVMRVLSFFFLVLVYSASFGQTTVFTLPGGGALPSGWTGINTNTTNAIDRTTYWLIDVNPTDTIITSSYDLSGYNSAEFDLDVASFGGGTHNAIKVDISFNGGTTYTQSHTFNSTTSTSYIASGTVTITSPSSSMVFRLVNAGSTGRGVRMQNLELRGLGAACTVPVDVTGSSTLAASGSLDVSWTNSTCFDEVVVFIDQTAGIGTTPSGGVGSYTGNSLYTSNGQCVYNGTGSSFSTTGLTNGTTYYFEIFTRKGTTWSSGIEISGTPAFGGLSMATLGTSLTIDFDNSLAGVNNGQYNGSGATNAPSTGQLNSTSWSIDGFAGTLNFSGTQTTGDYARGTSTGGTGTGGMYAFEVAASDYAFGVQAGGSDFTPGNATLRVLNATGSTVTHFLVEYDIYVYNDQGRGNTWNFSYSLDNSLYTNEVELDYTSPTLADASPAWRLNKRYVLIDGISLADNSFMYLRWSSDDAVGAGSRDEIALDNIIITPFTAAPIAQLFTPLTTVESIASDGVDITLNNATTTDTINLKDAIFSMGNNDLHIINGSFTGSTSEYIETNGTGILSKAYTGNASYTYPVGLSGYTPITLDFISGTYSAAALAGIRLVDAAHPNLASPSDYITRYWELSQSGISSFNCDITATYLTADVVGLESNIFSHKYDGTWLSGSATNAATNELTFSGATGFSDISGFELASLPVELIDFTASLEHNQSILNWTTAKELNNSHFEVFKSTDGKNFKRIGRVEGRGTTNDIKHYSLMDGDVQPVQYYQLKQLDFDGKHDYSEVIVLNTFDEKKSIVQQSSNDLIVIPIGVSELTIIDQNGKIVFSETVSSKTSINKNQFRYGFYTLQIASAFGVEKIKWVNYR